VPDRATGAGRRRTRIFYGFALSDPDGNEAMHVERRLLGISPPEADRQGAAQNLPIAA